MGLGKTVQVVALTGSCVHELGTAMRPFLIVVPLSTLPHWVREFERWLPELNVVAYHGNADARKLLREHEFDPLNRGVMRFDVLVSSYEGKCVHNVLPTCC
jgi:SNF2 family DNA or RNA helicase